MALFEDLVEKKLKVKPDFLQKSATVIHERLERAAVEFELEHANVFAINMCLHAASSIILSNPDSLRTTLQEIKEMDGLRERDSTTVLTVSALYYLLVTKWDKDLAEWEKTHPDYQIHLDKLRTGFDEVNWLIGTDAMRVVGIHKMEKHKRPGSAAVRQAPNRPQAGASGN